MTRAEEFDYILTPAQKGVTIPDVVVMEAHPGLQSTLSLGKHVETTRAFRNFVLIVLLCFPFLLILFSNVNDRKPILRLPRHVLQSTHKWIRGLQSSPPPNRSLWISVGCDTKYPLFSCQSKHEARGKGLGNVIAVNETHFRHPILQRHWNSCAIVGSSGRLLKTEYGRHIDDHEIVARINYPPIKGYEKHVGSRPSDIFFFGDKVDRCFNESHPEAKLMVFPLPYKNRRRGVSFEKCEANRELPLYTISNYIMGFAGALIYNYTVAHRPPTMKARQHVDAYGFGLSGDKEEPVHYYEKSTDSTRFRQAHKPNVELELMRHWPNTALSDFYPPFGKLRVFT
ncbi:CMP-N-acetylneuraminate-beta-galactosamide-alpha-2,3-sialyltransferase 1-like isoform X2 [Corticium candelabrum]|uniref:CMP-N-acetylneuraminate-beta-galactosamide- alpha-2,3-sialyltransferase 1-like isoform X2 n=1 Tax=Corticium candelabrum TaxID=121492 RepID=UPI002E266D70|nr:CMP-N-acetylneuraminate-beta-galactosamide-alpha-2,3-sialyltransferase 1-like isoform X2 [Corticium candelabrum]